VPPDRDPTSRGAECRRQPHVRGKNRPKFADRASARLRGWRASCPYRSVCAELLDI